MAQDPVTQSNEAPTFSGQGFTVHHQGWVVSSPVESSHSHCMLSRAARLPGGRWLCSFTRQSQIGMNDFRPYLYCSDDRGASWRLLTRLWPELWNDYSISASISGQGESLQLFGARYPIGRPGEAIWCSQTASMKPNRLFWSGSRDGGQTWESLREIAAPTAGSKEAPGPLLVTSRGTWLAAYVDYPELGGPHRQVEGHVAVCLRSGDQGRTWTAARALVYEPATEKSAENWIVELDSGVLVAAGWRIGPSDAGNELPHGFALSADDGRTWGAAGSLPTRGQALGAVPARGGRMIVVYNERRSAKPGVRLACLRLAGERFVAEWDAPVWEAVAAGTKGFERWTEFAFGEPSVTWVADDELLVTFWCHEQEHRGIRCAVVKTADARC